jgi:hypothetical protein
MADKGYDSKNIKPFRRLSIRYDKYKNTFMGFIWMDGWH